MTSRERRKLRSEELQRLASLLFESGLCPDVSPLYQSAAECLRPPRVAQEGTFGAGQHYWGYNVTDLRINLSELRHLRPVRVISKELEARLTVSVEELVSRDDDADFEEFGAIRKVQIGFFCDSVIEVSNDVVEDVRAAWHLDTHLFADTASHAVHPHFHFQFGGAGLEGLEVRGVFLPEEPRLAHPPLDAILAVDFVLSHYCGDAWKNERSNNTRYSDLVRPACKRYWHGYYRQIAEFFTRPPLADESVFARMLLPNLC